MISTFPGANTQSLSGAAILQIIKERSGGLLADHLEPVLELAQHIPAYSGNFLEWHLDKAAFPLDFIYRICGQDDKPLLTLDPVPFQENSVIGQGYQKLISKSENRFRHGIENVYFEYDFPGSSDPAIFFDLNRKSVDIPALKYTRLEEVCGYFQFSPATALISFLTKLHAHGFSNLHFGLMFSRSSGAIRLALDRFDASRLGELITVADWKGDYYLVEKVQKAFFKPNQKLMLSIDFDGQCGRRLGIEMCLPDPEIILPPMKSFGVISPDQCSFLDGWNGHTELDSVTAKSLSDLHQRPVRRLYRCINHFKFVIDEGAISTKAYLYYCF